MTEQLVGTQCYLRPFGPSDCSDDYIGWLNDPDVTRYLETGRSRSTRESVQRYLARFWHGDTDYLFAIMDRATDRHIGTVTLNNMHRHHRTANTGLMIGCKDYWGKGYAFNAWTLLLSHAFEQWGLHKVTAGVLRGNVACQRVLQKLGFQLEGTLRQQHLVEGVYHDALKFGLLSEEWRR